MLVQVYVEHKKDSKVYKCICKCKRPYVAVPNDSKTLLPKNYWK